MGLRPLHFQRVALTRVNDPDLPTSSVPGYGGDTYITDCRRFVILRTGEGWRVHSRNSVRWTKWDQTQGFWLARFPTRREALAALEGALLAEDLMDADVPTP